MGPGMGWGSGVPWLWSAIVIAFWIAVIVAVVFLIRWLILSTKNRNQASDPSLDILKTRYARGEIDKKEFEEKKRDLRNSYDETWVS